jgi:hypothetical protein
MRALKVLVVVMGVLLVGGTAALIAAIIHRASHPRPLPAASAGAARGFDRAVIDLPAGARVLGSEAVGERIMVRVGLAEGGEALILVDPRTGARLGTIELRRASPGEAQR